jgi:hypothetical protein
MLMNWEKGQAKDELKTIETTKGRVSRKESEIDKVCGCMRKHMNTNESEK